MYLPHPVFHLVCTHKRTPGRLTCLGAISPYVRPSVLRFSGNLISRLESYFSEKRISDRGG